MKTTLFIVLLALLYSLTTTTVQAKDVSLKTDNESQKREPEVFNLEYFLSVSLGQEYGGGKSDSLRLKKWATNINVYVASKPNAFLENELDLVLTELNPLVKPLSIKRVPSLSDSNLIVFLRSYPLGGSISPGCVAIAAQRRLSPQPFPVQG